MTSDFAPLNRKALISITCAALAALSACIAVAPIPLTGWVCYPAALVLGLAALAAGLASLAETRGGRQEDRTYALIGVWVGGLSAALSLCAITAAILLLPHIIELVKQYVK